MNKKIFHALFIAALVAMLLSAAVSITVFYFSYSDRVMGDLRAELSYLKIAYDDDPASVADASMTLGRRLTVIGPDGTVSYDSISGIFSYLNFHQPKFWSFCEQNMSPGQIFWQIYAEAECNASELVRIALLRREQYMWRSQISQKPNAMQANLFELH